MDLRIDFKNDMVIHGKVFRYSQGIKTDPIGFLISKDFVDCYSFDSCLLTTLYKYFPSLIKSPQWLRIENFRFDIERINNIFGSFTDGTLIEYLASYKEGIYRINISENEVDVEYYLNNIPINTKHDIIIINRV